MVDQALLTRDEALEAIDRLPRVLLAAIPTPLEECRNLTEALGGPRIFIKRDDLTGLGFGGNKVRHMEFCMGDALAQGADVSINANLWVSNNSRIIGAAATKVGLRFVCVVTSGKGKPYQGNLLVNHLMGAELHLLDSSDGGYVSEYLAILAEEERAKGHTPYVHDFQPMSRMSGSIAYFNATLELADQMAEAGIQEAHIYLVSGASTGGLALGAKTLGLPWKITGVNVSSREVYFSDVYGWADGAAERLDLPLRLLEGEVIITDDYIGPGYPIPGPDSVEAVRLVARTEAIILEPIYTGKAMACLIDHVRKGIIASRDTVVFIHTGGLPELFSYSAELTQGA